MSATVERYIVEGMESDSSLPILPVYVDYYPSVACVPHDIGLTPEVSKRFKSYLIGVYGSTRLPVSATVERYILEGMIRDNTDAGRKKLETLKKTYRAQYKARSARAQLRMADEHAASFQACEAVNNAR
jgi:hypothetical protein